MLCVSLHSGLPFSAFGCPLASTTNLNSTTSPAVGTSWALDSPWLAETFPVVSAKEPNSAGSCEEKCLGHQSSERHRCILPSQSCHERTSQCPRGGRWNRFPWHILITRAHAAQKPWVKQENYTTVDPKQFVFFKIGTLCNQSLRPSRAGRQRIARQRRPQQGDKRKGLQATCSPEPGDK